MQSIVNGVWGAIGSERVMLKAMLLDVDGTLVRRNDAHAEAWSRTLGKFGYDVPFTTVRRWIGMGGDKLRRHVDPDLTDECEPGKAIAQFRQQLFLRDYGERIKPTNGARALLERLGAEKLSCVVATSAAEERAAVLKAAGIEDAIDMATTSDDAQKSKPDPDIVIEALSKVSCRTDEATYLGDTPYDITAAHSGTRRQFRRSAVPQPS